MGRRGSGSTRYSMGLAARATGNIVLSKGMATSIGQYLQYSCLEDPLSDREVWQAIVYRVAKSWTRPK